MNRKAHWEQVWSSKPANSLSWFQPEATMSLRLIQRFARSPGDPIIDVGGGSSVLLAQLARAGYRNLTLLDLSGAALELARAALPAHAAPVTFVQADVLTSALPAETFSVWHDRALFHFLTDPADRATYLAQARHAIAPSGHLVLATFAEDGATRCSGLDVARYSAEGLREEFLPGFELQESHRDEHRTPSGSVQPFTYGVFRRTTTHPSGPTEEAIAGGRACR